MSVLRESIDDDRGINKFYSKIQGYIDQIELPRCESRRYRDIPDEQIYGDVTKEQFMKIMDAYKDIPSSAEAKSKPLSCDEVDGKTFARVLFSKVGFHNPNSTSHLISELGIADTNRNSFLGGFSTYSVNKGETIEELKLDRYNRILTRMLGEAEHLLKDGSSERAESMIEEAMRVDPNNPETLRVKARCLFSKKEYSDSIKTYRVALENGAANERIYPHISDAYYQRGLKYFSQADYKTALKDFEQAMQYSKQQEGADLHRKLCISRLRDSNRLSKSYDYRK